MEFFESKSLSSESISRVVTEIRAILPQSRGSIVSSRNSILPLSKTKKLNLGNTPVLIVEEKRKPIYVFPCRLGESYYNVEDGLEIIRSNWPVLRPLKGEMEDLIARRIKEHPDLLEDGLRLEASEANVEAGNIDIVLRDALGSPVLVEVEREADDATLGQILRLASSFEMSQSSNPKKKRVRAGIVCLRVKKFIPAAAKRANVEIWQSSSSIPNVFVKL